MIDDPVILGQADDPAVRRQHPDEGMAVDRHQMWAQVERNSIGPVTISWS